MIRLAYRKSYYLTHPWAAAREAYLDIYYGIRNVFRWLPVIWWDDDGDWSHLATIMEKKLKSMADCHRGSMRHIGWERTDRQLRTASELIRRVNNEHYYKNIMDREDWCPPIGPWKKQNSPGLFDKKNQKCYDEYMSVQDLALFSELFRKYLRHWWT